MILIREICAKCHAKMCREYMETDEYAKVEDMEDYLKDCMKTFNRKWSNGRLICEIGEVKKGNTTENFDKCPYVLEHTLMQDKAVIV